MPRISLKKQEKIKEQILHYLFSISPSSIFTNQIANEIARDEEFTLSLLQELEKNKIVTKITKNPQGIKYQKRQRWRLSSEAFNVYKKHQS